MTRTDYSETARKRELVEAIAPFGKPARRERSSRLDLFAFVSFDLVNSTEYKVANPGEWATTIDIFYQSVRSIVAAIDNVHLWKYLGDEVLVCARMTSEDGLGKIASVVYDCLLKLIVTVGDASQKAMSVKAMLWLSPLVSRTDVNADIDKCDPIISELAALQLQADILIDGSLEPGSIVDFLGPNIDAGFRLKHFTRAGQLVCSPMLSALATELNPTCANHFRIVDYATLRGVAKGELFPGVWYSADASWNAIKNSFHPSDRFIDEVVERVCNDRTEKIQGIQMSSQQIASYLISSEHARRLFRLELSDPLWLSRLQALPKQL